MRAKQQDSLLKNLKSNDRVVTSSGIVGIVISVKEKSVTLRSADSKLEVLKSAVTEITEKSNAGDCLVTRDMSMTMKKNVVLGRRVSTQFRPRVEWEPREKLKLKSQN